MAPFSSAKEKQANSFNGDNEEDERICSFGDGKARGVLHCGQQRSVFLFPAEGLRTKMSDILLSQGEDVENITTFNSILSLIYSLSGCNFMGKSQIKTDIKVLRCSILRVAFAWGHVLGAQLRNYITGLRAMIP